ncbi:MAG: hypothetical protein K6T74_16130 [Geminicoccaceae bacterium]|nr:hypothetical protein [Geminicoccaceae bacterium]
MSPRLSARLEEREGRAALLLAAALAVLGAAMLVWRGGTIAFPDEREYLHLARGLLATGSFGPDGSPSAYRLPLYPAFLALLLVLRDDPLLVQAVQLGLWLATGLVLRAIARERAGPLAGLLALGLWGAYPHALFLATTLHPQALLAPALALSLALTLGRPSVARAAALGLLGGLASLLVAHALVPAVIHLGLLAGRLGGRRALVALLAGGALLALPPVLWIARNERALGAPVLTTNSGINLLLGNAPGVRPETGTRLELGPYAEATRGLSELEADRVFRRLALDWIRAHPEEAARLYLGKLLHWVAAVDRLATEAEGGRGRALLATLGWYGLLALLLFGSVLALRAGRLDPRLFVASWGAWLAAALLYAVFFTRVRFRIPFDALLVPAAAIGLALRLGGPTRGPSRTPPPQ